MGNCLGLGSVWVSSQVQSSGYIANNYPRSAFDLAVFGGKFNSSWRSQTAKHTACLRLFFSSASHTAIPGRFSYPKLRVMKNAYKASATTISAISSVAVFVL